MEEQNNPTSGRIPCLDGIRAISIMMVLLSHLYGTRNFDRSGWEYLNSLGGLGVRVFFVISGFLITSLLIKEQDKTGKVSLSRFYFNRTFRIFPAFYTFVACIAIVSTLNYVSLNSGDLFHAVTYTTNYHPDHAWTLAHIWSLAVEEQFYILWPVIFLCFGVRGAFFAAVVCILIAPAVRVLSWIYLPLDREGIGHTFQTVADSIASGCVLAFIRSKYDVIPFISRFQKNKISLIILLFVIFSVNSLRDYPSFMLPVGQTILNISIALVIDCCLRNRYGALAKILNARPLVFVGTLSYSLYLWQQPFLNRYSDAMFSSAPYNLMFTFMCALISYYVVEKPFLSLRSQLARKWFNRRALSVATSI